MTRQCENLASLLNHPKITTESPIHTLKMGSLPAFTEHDVTITSFEITDLRFPTSLDGVGSDAMHVGTNGSHPFIQLKTNRPGLVGEGIVSELDVILMMIELTRDVCRPSATAEEAN